MRTHRALGFLGRLFQQAPSDRVGSAPASNSRHGENTRGERMSDVQRLVENSAQAVQRVEKAAGAGDAVAQTSYGLRYASGQGVLRNDLEARKWFRRAAEQGHAGGQFNLGNLYHTASLQHLAPEVAQARIEAYMWFHLAAAQGHREAAASCEMLNLTMTNAELDEGNRRARAFQVRKEDASSVLS
jgi:TPR repeat protein